MYVIARRASRAERSEVEGSRRSNLPAFVSHRLHEIIGNTGIVQVDKRITSALCAFSGRLRGLELVPSKRRDLIPPRRIEPVEITSGYPYRVLTQTQAVGRQTFFITLASKEYRLHNSSTP